MLRLEDSIFQALKDAPLAIVELGMVQVKKLFCHAREKEIFRWERMSKEPCPKPLLFCFVAILDFEILQGFLLVTQQLLRIAQTRVLCKLEQGSIVMISVACEGLHN